MPIGIPGWPLLAASTASIASARMALARRRWVGCIGAPAKGFGAASGLRRRHAPFVRCAGQRQCLRPSCTLRSRMVMDDNGLSMALDRADRALQRIEQALANRQPAPARDEQLRARVREAVAELDQLIKEAAV